MRRNASSIMISRGGSEYSVACDFVPEHVPGCRRGCCVCSIGRLLRSTPYTRVLRYVPPYVYLPTYEGGFFGSRLISPRSRSRDPCTTAQWGVARAFSQSTKIPTCHNIPPSYWLASLSAGCVLTQTPVSPSCRMRDSNPLPVRSIKYFVRPRTQLSSQDPLISGRRFRPFSLTYYSMSNLHIHTTTRTVKDWSL